MFVIREKYNCINVFFFLSKNKKKNKRGEEGKREETANAKAGKHEECDSLKTGRMCRGLVNKTEVWGVRHRAKAGNYGSS